jgi:hypothetical protein
MFQRFRSPRAATSPQREDVTLQQVDLASDISGMASVTDPNLENARVTRCPRPRSRAPSGHVANTGTEFVLSNGTVKAPAAFIFATLDGHIEAWSHKVDRLIGDAEGRARDCLAPGGAWPAHS